MPSLFERQIATYAACHRDPRNRLTHYVGIPSIMFSLVLALCLWRMPAGPVVLSGAWIVAALAAAGWIALDLTLGLVVTAVLVVMVLAGEWLALSLSSGAVWTAFWVLFVGGWALQFLGHAFEGRRPAFLDNLLQAFIGPMFVAAEALAALGLRADPLADKVGRSGRA